MKKLFYTTLLLISSLTAFGQQTFNQNTLGYGFGTQWLPFVKGLGDTTSNNTLYGPQWWANDGRGHSAWFVTMGHLRDTLSHYAASTGVNIRFVTNVATLGDSFTSESSYPAQLQTILGVSWQVSNDGSPGDGTSRMLARLPALIATYSKYISILGITNDLNGSLTALQIEANIQAMYTLAHSAGKKVIAMTPTPIGSSSIWTSGKQAIIDSVRTWQLHHATNYDYILDDNVTLRNPADTLKLLPAYDSGDGNHINITGSIALATALNSAVTFTANTPPAVLSLSGNTDINQNLRNDQSVFWQHLNTNVINVVSGNLLSTPFPTMVAGDGNSAGPLTIGAGYYNKDIGSLLLYNGSQLDTSLYRRTGLALGGTQQTITQNPLTNGYIQFNKLNDQTRFTFPGATSAQTYGITLNSSFFEIGDFLGTHALYLAQGTAGLNDLKYFLSGVGTYNILHTGNFVSGVNYAPVASPTFTGAPAAPTQSLGNNSTTLATTAYADRVGTNLLSSANNWTGATNQFVKIGIGVSPTHILDVVGAANNSIPIMTIGDGTAKLDTYVGTSSSNVQLGTSSNTPILMFANNGASGTNMTLNTNATVNFGVAAISPSFRVLGSSSGTVSIIGTSGTFNFNLPTSAGSTGQAFLSGGGSSTPNTWASLNTAIIDTTHTSTGVATWSNLNNYATKAFTNSTYAKTSSLPIHGNSTTTGAATTRVTVTIGSTMANTAYFASITAKDLLTSVNYYVDPSTITTATFDVVFVTALTGSINFDWCVTP